MASTWHPLLELQEPTPGRWELNDYIGRPYGTIEIRRTPGGVRYRCEHQGDLIGWASTLRLAAERVHQTFLRTHGPQGGSISDHGTR